MSRRAYPANFGSLAAIRPGSSQADWSSSAISVARMSGGGQQVGISKALVFDPGEVET
jgi:hypothetical protein